MRFVGTSLWLLIAAGALAAAQQPPSTSGSGPGVTHAVGFYDASLERVLLIGGDTPPDESTRDRAWSWSGKTWDSVTTDGPAARTNAAAAYDQGRRIAVVAGGARLAADKTNRVISDTWEQRSSQWHQREGIEFDPRDHHSMVYDETRNAVLLFGGIPANRSATWPSDTWQLSPAGWQRILTDGPPGRARAAMVYDSKRQQVVLFGGVGAAPGPRAPQPFLQDTWIFERDRWRQLPVAGPPARYAHGMVFDERAGVVLMYSGAAAHKNAPLTDMWQWDGVRWTEITLSGPTPGYRYQPVMVYDRRRGKTVLFGGLQGSRETWEWDGKRWSEIP